MQELSNLSVHENFLGSCVDVDSEAPPLETESEVSLKNLYFSKFQVIHGSAFRSLGIDVPQPW